MRTDPAPAPPQGEGAYCHHMGRTLERAADGRAGPLARTAAHVHTLSCAGCRAHLAELKATQTQK